MKQHYKLCDQNLAYSYATTSCSENLDELIIIHNKLYFNIAMVHLLWKLSLAVKYTKIEAKKIG